MNASSLKTLSVAALAFGSSSISFASGSFEETAAHLDLGGTFVGFMDFDGDGQVIGEKLNVIYQEFAAANPDVPPFPIDFPSIFEALGFGSVKSMGMSSMEVEEGLFRNMSVTMLEGDPAGLLSMYGMDSIPFRAAEIAPADATTVMSGRIDFTALSTTANDLATRVMGPMGEGMVAQGLTQPVPGTELTVGELLVSLSNGMDLIMSQSFENPQQPDMKIWLSLSGAGSLLPQLEPVLAQQGVELVDTGDGVMTDLSALTQKMPFGLFLEAPADTDDLILYTDAEWISSFGSESGGLMDTEEFQKVTNKLPKDAAFYAYSSGLDVSQLVALLEANPDTAAMAPAIGNAVESLFGGLLGPNASATYHKDDALITEGYAGFSYKGLLMALPAGIGAGVGAGIAAQQAAQADVPQSE